MRSLVCEGDGRVRLADVPEPQPRPGEALIRIEVSALCGSERPTLMNGRSAMPANTGHEACGQVVDPGSSGFRVGDRVGLSAVVGCGRCDACRAGRELHCRDEPTISEGWHAEFVAVAPAALRELPDGLDAATGVLLTGDSLGVPVRALHRVPSRPDDRVLVIGLGPVGLGHVAVRSFAGAEVVGIEPSAYRRRLALKLGASTVLPPEQDVGRGYAAVIECSGRPENILLAFHLADDAGTVIQSGECHTPISISPSDTFVRREITYTGSWYYATEDYPGMRELLERGLPLSEMCTHDVAAVDAQPAITDFLRGDSGKVVLRWS